MINISKINKIINVFLNLVIIVLIILAIILYTPRIFGFKTYTVKTGSMLPTYKIGSIIYVEPITNIDNLSIGDVITFRRGTNIITHRINNIDKGNKLIETKGDNNISVDSAKVDYNSIIGVVKFNIPFLGYISLFLSNEPIFKIIIIVSTIIAILAVFIR